MQQDPQPTSQYSLNPSEWNPVWVQDAAACQICRADFGMFLWKHHCRRCGKCVCDECSPFMPPEEEIRVCKPCITEHKQAFAAHIRAEMTSKMMPKKEVTAKDVNLQITWFSNQTDLPLKQHIIERKLKAGQASSLIEDLLKLNWPLVDKLILHLSLDKFKLPDDNYRIAMLYFLSQTLKDPNGLDTFNRKSSSNTRIERIIVLLHKDNFFLLPTKDILASLEYKSMIFEKIRAGFPLHYTLAVDKSETMQVVDRGLTDHTNDSRWVVTTDSVAHLVDQINEKTGGGEWGTTLWFFNTETKKYPQMRTSEQVLEAFHKENAEDQTAELAEILEKIFCERPEKHGKEHFGIFLSQAPRPEHHRKVVMTLTHHIYNLRDADELGITFLQVGKDEKTAVYLSTLRRSLETEGVAFNVVDAVTYKDVDDQSLFGFVHRCLPTSFIR